MTDFIIKYWIQVALGLIVAAISAGFRHIIKRFKTVKNEQDAIKTGIQALLRDRIIQNYNHYKEKGFCPIYALENIEKMYTEYRNLGGNGTITTLVEELRKMDKIKEDREDV